MELENAAWHKQYKSRVGHTQAAGRPKHCGASEVQVRPGESPDSESLSPSGVAAAAGNLLAGFKLHRRTARGHWQCQTASGSLKEPERRCAGTGTGTHWQTGNFKFELKPDCPSLSHINSGLKFKLT